MDKETYKTKIKKWKLLRNAVWRPNKKGITNGYSLMFYSKKVKGWSDFTDFDIQTIAELKQLNKFLTRVLKGK